MLHVRIAIDADLVKGLVDDSDDREAVDGHAHHHSHVLRQLLSVLLAADRHYRQNKRRD